MKKINIYHIMMVAILVLQIALGVFLALTALYMDEYYYLSLDAFFFFFCHIPGASLVIMGLHYLLFWKYEKKNTFIFTGCLCAFIISNTGECLILLNTNFPEGWQNYVIWFILTNAVVALITGVFHLFFVLFYKKALFHNET